MSNMRCPYCPGHLKTGTTCGDCDQHYIMIRNNQDVEDVLSALSIAIRHRMPGAKNFKAALRKITKQIMNQKKKGGKS